MCRRNRRDAGTRWGCSSPAPTAAIASQAPGCAAGTTGSWPQEPAPASGESGVTAGNTGTGGGPVIASIKVYFVSVNHPASYYGSPDVFWAKVNCSPLIHVLDEYVNSTANNRYPIADDIEIDGVTAYGQDSDSAMNAILASAYQALAARGDGDINSLTGNSAEYDLILPSSGGCGGGSHSLLEPVIAGQTHPMNTARITGCTDASGSASAILHENFEQFTDPDGSDGWGGGKNENTELADACQDYLNTYTFSDGSKYQIQSLFSKSQNACVYSPP